MTLLEEASLEVRDMGLVDHNRGEESVCDMCCLLPNLPAGDIEDSLVSEQSDNIR